MKTFKLFTFIKTKVSAGFTKFCNFVTNLSKKQKAICFTLYCTLFTSAFAEGELDTAAETLLKIVTGKPLKVVLILAVIVCFGVIAWGQSQGEGGMFKKVLPVIIGCIGVASASGVVNTFYNKDITASLIEPQTKIIYEIKQPVLLT